MVTWKQDGKERWILQSEASDLIEIIKDGTGFWVNDLRFNDPRLIQLCSTLEEAQKVGQDAIN